jgi:RNA polymerase sigma-70 factor, ECF subfamily
LVGPNTAEHYSVHDPDVRLMLRVKNDDAAAFEELVARYQQRVVTLLEHLVRDRSSAEDLAQDVFLKVFRSRKSYEPSAKFATWFFTIANNVASNARRDRARRHEVNIASTGSSESTALPLQEMALATSSQMPARRADKSEMAEIVRQAMESLSERQRTALLLCKFEGMSYQDIADTMGMTVKAAKSLLMRARVNLKEILEPYMQEGVRPTAKVPDDR